MYALDGTTGALKWTSAIGSDVYSSPAIGADGTVYIGRCVRCVRVCTCMYVYVCVPVCFLSHAGHTRVSIIGITK